MKSVRTRLTLLNVFAMSFILAAALFATRLTLERRLIGAVDNEINIASGGEVDLIQGARTVETHWGDGSRMDFSRFFGGPPPMFGQGGGFRMNDNHHPGDMPNMPMRQPFGDGHWNERMPPRDSRDASGHFSPNGFGGQSWGNMPQPMFNNDNNSQQHAKPGDLSKSDNRSKSGDGAKPGDEDRPGDHGRPGDNSGRPGDDGDNHGNFVRPGDDGGRPGDGGNHNNGAMDNKSSGQGNGLNMPMPGKIVTPEEHFRSFVERRRQSISPGVTYALLGLTGASLVANPVDVVMDRAGYKGALRNQKITHTVIVGKNTYRVLSQPLVDTSNHNKIFGVLQSYENIKSVKGELRHLTNTLLWICPFALICSALAGAFLTSRALRPVREFSLAAQKISAKNLNERLPVSGNDEFSMLAVTFNDTLSRLQDAFVRLQESLEQQRRLTADASHELRTPLTVIKAHTSLSLTSVRSRDQYLATIKSVDLAADIMSRIVQDLLLLARADAGQLLVQNELQSIGSIVEDSVEAAKALDGPPIELAEIDPDILVQGDSHLLGRVILNVLSNAKRHTPDEGLVSVSAELIGANVVVKVIDNGEGIPAEHLPHIGERFYRVDASRERSRGGTGLGLAICKTILSAHNGSLTIESEEGKGATVKITLPVAKEDK